METHRFSKFDNCLLNIHYVEQRLVPHPGEIVICVSSWVTEQNQLERILGMAFWNKWGWEIVESG